MKIRGHTMRSLSMTVAFAAMTVEIWNKIHRPDM